MSIVIAWICSLAGLALVWLIALASGMKTAPKMQGGDVVLGLPLPAVALALAVPYVTSRYADEPVRAALAGGIPALIGLVTIALLGLSFLTQPSPPSFVSKIKEILTPRRALQFYRETTGTTGTVRIAYYPPRKWSPKRLERNFQRLVMPGEEETVVTAYALEAEPLQKPSAPRTRVLVGAADTVTLVDEHSHVAIDDLCFIAIGRELVCLSVPQLELRWRMETDPDVMIGVHRLDETMAEARILAHGASCIRRVRRDGSIAWTFEGKAPLTRGIRIREEHLEVTDSDQNTTYVRLSDGTKIDR